VYRRSDQKEGQFALCNYRFEHPPDDDLLLTDSRPVFSTGLESYLLTTFSSSEKW
jgi:hypothetical protein